jgi:hypothetical protein
VSDVPADAIEGLADELIGAVNQRMSEVMTDANLPGRDDVVLSFILLFIRSPWLPAWRAMPTRPRAIEIGKLSLSPL